MSNIEWDTERLYVLEMLKETRAGLSEQQKMIHQFKVETSNSITEIKTKLGMQTTVITFVVSTAISIASKFIG